MFKMRNTKGITLIALVITIIVLLILASISLNLLIGNRGVINLAKEGKIKTEIAREKEIIQLALGDIQINKLGELIFNEDELAQALNDNSSPQERTTVEKMSTNLYNITFEKSKREYEVYSDGTVKNSVPNVTDDTPTEIAKKDDNTYLIQSIEDLVVLSNTVNAGTDTFDGKTFELQIDLNFASKKSYRNPEGNDFGDVNGDGVISDTLIEEMTTSAGFMPIGKNSSESFKGNINGNNHTISNLYINRNEYGQGFIGSMEANNNIIENIKMDSINIISGRGDNGGIIGRIYTEDATITIRNIQVSGKMKCGEEYSGGIVGKIRSGGKSSALIEKCSSYVDFNINRGGGILGGVNDLDKLEIKDSYNVGRIEGNTEIGGITGAFYYTKEVVIEDCYNEGNIKCNNSYAGGLVAEFYFSEKLTMTNCYNKGNIKCNSSYVGGIIGRTEGDCTITNCYNEGYLQGSYSSVGGIVGSYESGISKGCKINKCYNLGTIEVNGSRAGGILGGDSYLTGAIIINCYNLGNINVETNSGGGISGYGCFSIKDCYNVGDVSSKTNSDIGGISGGSCKQIDNVYNVGNISGTYNIGGILGSSYNSSINNAYNLGKVVSKNYGGGIAGNDYNITYIKAYYMKGTEEKGGGYHLEDEEDILEVKEEAEIIQLMHANLVGETWEIGEGEKYPTLKFN